MNDPVPAGDAIDEASAPDRGGENSGPRQALPWGFILLVFVALTWLGKQLSTFLEPLLLAAFFTYLLHPMASWLERRRFPAIIAYALTIATVGVVFFGFGRVIVDSIERFQERAHAYQPNLERITQSLTELAHDLGLLAYSEELTLEQLASDFPEMAQTAVSAVTTFMLKGAGFGLVMAFFMVFMIQESHYFESRLRLGFGDQRAGRVLRITRVLNADVQRYVVLKAIVSLVTGGLAFVVLVAFGVEFAPILALIIFAFNFIPYVGSIAATILPGLVAMLQFPSAWNALIVVALITAIQQVLGNLWEPHLQGRKLNVSPLLILIALAYFGWMWGVVGMVVSVPLIAGLRLLLEQFPRTRFIAALMSDAVIEAERRNGRGAASPSST